MPSRQRIDAFSPSAVVVIAGAREVEAAEAPCGFDGVAVRHGAKRQLLLGPVVGTEPDADETKASTLLQRRTTVKPRSAVSL